MVYINLEKEFLKKTEKKANEDAIAEMGEESGENILMYSDLKEDECYIDEINDDGIINIIINGEWGYIGAKIGLDDDDFIKIANLLIKRFNKFKSVVESLK